MTLADLGKKIKSDHEAPHFRHPRQSSIVPSAIGEDLNKAKEQVGHGSFLKWVKALLRL